MIENKTIYLSYTQDEWNILTQIANERAGKNLRIWLNREIWRLAKKVDTGSVCISCLDNKIVKKPQNFSLMPHVTKEIECLAARLGVGRATIIQRFVIDKYLTEHYETAGFGPEIGG